MTPTGGKASRQAELAERLQARIESGELTPGDPLPSEPDMMKKENESRFVVRGALEILRLAGLVEKRQGVGTVVIARDAIRIDASRMQDLDARERETAQDQDALGSAVADAGHIPTHRFRLGVVYARDEPEAAAYLGVPPDETLTLREVRRLVNGQPRMIESGYFPERVTSRPGLERIRQPVDIAEGTTLYLARNGFPDLVHFDDTDTRPPAREERDFLETDQWVLTQWRVTLDRLDGTPIRAIRIAYRGDRYRLRHYVAGRGNPTFEIKENR